MAVKLALVHSDEYANWIFYENHPTQGRRFLNARRMFLECASTKSALISEVSPRLATHVELERVHSKEYVQEVTTQHRCNEWSGTREDLAHLAQLFVGGTLIGLDLLLKGEADIAIHFPGAKHHAQYNYSSGFCVFADFALAADVATKDYGKRVAILDFDAHHGDGTENLTKENKGVLTFSIHEYGIFPGTGYESFPEQLVHNYPLGSVIEGHDRYKNDEALMRGVTSFVEEAKAFSPDVIFVACGADGHEEDPLTSLQFTSKGFISVAHTLRQEFPGVPLLVGGAGGYLPDTRTPEMWSQFACALLEGSTNR